MKSLSKWFVGVTGSIVASVASAGVITDWEGTGVDFYSSWLSPSTLRIEIDAANPMAGWANAVAIDSIAINGEGAWSWSNISDITLAGPAGFDATMDGTGLDANGCKLTLTLGANHQCWTGYAGLTDNMYFDFTFSGGAVISDYTDNPHLKVRFVDDSGAKVGSLLSQDLLSTSVPEPSSIAVLTLGIAGLLAARRKSR